MSKRKSKKADRKMWKQINLILQEIEEAVKDLEEDNREDVKSPYGREKRKEDVLQ